MSFKVAFIGYIMLIDNFTYLDIFSSDINDNTINKSLIDTYDALRT